MAKVSLLAIAVLAISGTAASQATPNGPDSVPVPDGKVAFGYTMAPWEKTASNTYPNTFYGELHCSGGICAMSLIAIGPCDYPTAGTHARVIAGLQQYSTATNTMLVSASRDGAAIEIRTLVKSSVGGELSYFFTVSPEPASASPRELKPLQLRGFKGALFLPPSEGHPQPRLVAKLQYLSREARTLPSCPIYFPLEVIE